jgi:hypothetical protein
MWRAGGKGGPGHWLASDRESPWIAVVCGTRGVHRTVRGLRLEPCQFRAGGVEVGFGSLGSDAQGGAGIFEGGEPGVGGGVKFVAFALGVGSDAGDSSAAWAWARSTRWMAAASACWARVVSCSARCSWLVASTTWRATSSRACSMSRSALACAWSISAAVSAGSWSVRSAEPRMTSRNAGSGTHELAAVWHELHAGAVPDLD